MKAVMTKCRGELKPMHTLEVTLPLPSGEVLWLGRDFTRKYAAICRNWHIAFLGLDLPLAEVWDEKCDRYGQSWTYWSEPDPGFLARMSDRRKASIAAAKAGAKQEEKSL
jgi:hypothetical protein